MGEKLEINSDFVKSILDKLSAMEKIIVEAEETDTLILIKDGIDFGRIKNNRLYLFNEYSTLYKIDDGMITKQDELLQVATRSHWIASGKKRIAKK